MKKAGKILLYGFLTWLIPFVISFFFYTREGELQIDIFLFKSIMIVVGFISASWLMVCYFKKVETDYLKTGLVLGIAWLIINLALDFLILLPMSEMSINDYFAQIGLRYLAIPAITIAMGAALANKK